VIEDLIQPRHRFNVRAYLQPLLIFGHRRVRSLRYERIEPRDAAPGESTRGEREKQIRIVVSRLVRDDRQHPRATSHVAERLFDNSAQLFA
jgi:predicted subunit of tRNA(5-methylaminomethyl-2-thiouridylate) methyltransferase